MSRTFHVPAHPGASEALANRGMGSFPRRDTRPEKALRSLLHTAGLRYRVNYPVPGVPRRTIDVAFTRVKLAVFIDGCYWHGCSEHFRLPTSNADWWHAKLAANMARDIDTLETLNECGWRVLRFWDHVPAADAATAVQAEYFAVAECVPSNERVSRRRDLA